MLKQLTLAPSKFYSLKKRQLRETQHNGKIPNNLWLLESEINAIVQYRLNHKSKGSVFHRPGSPHQHWHLDISYINFNGSFDFLVAHIHGFSRMIVRFEIKPSLEALDGEILMERAHYNFPGVAPDLISDNGPQSIAKEFNHYLHLVDITHRKTRFFFPQSMDKIKRFFQCCKNEAVRRQNYRSIADLKRQIENYIRHYIFSRLYSAIGYITPNDMLFGRQSVICIKRRF